MKRWEWASIILLTALILICAVIGIGDSIVEQREWDRQQAVAHSCEDRPMYYGGK